MMIVNVGCGITPTKDAINIDNSFTVKLAYNSFCANLHVWELPV